jgi:hypothetical protein
VSAKIESSKNPLSVQLISPNPIGRHVLDTQEKLEAITDTLGLMFPGWQATLHTDSDYATFTISGKTLRFAKDFLKASDLDHVLVMCHAAISELKRRPHLEAVRIGAPAK